MTDIKVDFSKIKGRIKAMHSVGQPPLVGVDTSYFSYLKDAHIPYSRLHDVGGWFGGNMFVDIPNIFRNFDADVNDPMSYDFTFTDLLIKALTDNGVEPYFRLGVTIENFHEIKAYRIFPPTDNQKWAEICEHIIRHYNEGWADGFHFNITYWEIWNEPDSHYDDIKQSFMWKGTPEQYLELYKTTSLHLRKCFGNSIKIGGYASCGFYAALNEQTISGEAFGVTKTLSNWDLRAMGFIKFFKLFLNFVNKENLPFDFFSYHSYGGVKDNLLMQNYCEKMLDEYGFDNIEIHLNEWNTNPRIEQVGTSESCANAVALMCEMQNTRMSVMCYYDAQMKASAYGGLFNAYTYKPFATYYGFLAFGELYEMGKQVEAESNNKDVYVLSAIGNGRKGLLISNIGEDDTISISGINVKKAYLIDENHHFTETEIDASAIEISKYGVLYIECI